MQSVQRTRQPARHTAKACRRCKNAKGRSGRALERGNCSPLPPTPASTPHGRPCLLGPRRLLARPLAGFAWASALAARRAGAARGRAVCTALEPSRSRAAAARAAGGRSSARAAVAAPPGSRPRLGRRHRTLAARAAAPPGPPLLTPACRAALSRGARNGGAPGAGHVAARRLLRGAARAARARGRPGLLALLSGFAGGRRACVRGVRARVWRIRARQAAGLLALLALLAPWGRWRLARQQRQEPSQLVVGLPQAKLRRRTPSQHSSSGPCCNTELAAQRAHCGPAVGGMRSCRCSQSEHPVPATSGTLPGRLCSTYSAGCWRDTQSPHRAALGSSSGGARTEALGPALASPGPDANTCDLHAPAAAHLGRWALLTRLLRGRGQRGAAGRAQQRRQRLAREQAAGRGERAGGRAGRRGAALCARERAGQQRGGRFRQRGQVRPQGCRHLGPAVLPGAPRAG